MFRWRLDPSNCGMMEAGNMNFVQDKKKTIVTFLNEYRENAGRAMVTFTGTKGLVTGRNAQWLANELKKIAPVYQVTGVKGGLPTGAHGDKILIFVWNPGPGFSTRHPVYNPGTWHLAGHINCKLDSAITKLGGKAEHPYDLGRKVFKPSEVTLTAGVYYVKKKAKK